MQLGPTYVDGDDVGCPVLEQAVGEAPSGGTGVKGASTADGNVETGKGARQLLPAAADEPGWWTDQRQRVAGKDEASRRCGWRTADQDASRRDCVLRLGPACGQAAPDQLAVEALPSRLSRGLLGRGGLLGGGLRRAGTALRQLVDLGFKLGQIGLGGYAERREALIELLAYRAN